MPEKQYNTFTSQEELTDRKQGTMESSHKLWFLALIFLNFLVLLVVYFFNGISATDFGVSSGIFHTTNSNQSDKYYLQITPAGWTFSIWGFIYTWQALWVLYSLVNVFRKTAQGPAYLHPEILPPMLFVFYILANGSCLGWLFFFDRNHIEAAFVALFLIPCTLILGMAVAYRSYDRSLPRLLAEGRTKDVWLLRLVVHNALAIYATWTAIASLLNLAIVLTYSARSSLSMETACTVALGVLAGEIAVFVVTDLALLDRYSRYTFTPYLVVVVALVGSISKNWEEGAVNSVFTAVLLGLGAAALLLKVVFSLHRHVTRKNSGSAEFLSTMDSELKVKGGTKA